MAKYTEAQKRAVAKYMESRSPIKFVVTTEQKEKFQALAKSKGVSLTQLIVNLLEAECDKE